MVMRKPLKLQLINYEYTTEQTEKVLNFEEITGCSSVQGESTLFRRYMVGQGAKYTERRE